MTRNDILALAGVSIFALIVRVAFVSAVHPTPVSDFAWYYRHAIQITQGLGFTTNGVPTAYWPPGWPYFLAGVFSIFGPHVYAGELAQAALDTLTVSLIFLIALRAAGTAAAVFAAMLYALLPSSIEWTSVLGTEPLYTLLWVLATYIWISTPVRQLGWFALSGIIIGAAALVRPTALLAWGALLIYLWLTTQRKTFRAVVLPPLIVLLFATAAVTPDLIRNYRIFHTFVLICNTGGTTLWIGNSPYYHPGDVSLHNARLQKMTDDPRTELAADRIAEQMALSYIKEHPGQTAARALLKLRALYARDDGAIQYAFGPDAPARAVRAALLVNRIFYYLLLALSIAGFAFCVRNRSRLPTTAWIMLFLNILYNTAPFIIAPSYDRYHFSSMPFFAVFAGIGVAALVSRRGARLTA